MGSVRGMLTLNHAFWLGFAIYTVAQVLYSIAESNFAFFQMVQLLGIMLFLPAAVFQMKWNLESQYLQLIFILYSLWVCYLLLSGLPDLKNPTFLKKFLFNPKIGFLYLVPAVILIPLTGRQLRNLFYTILLFAITFLLLCMFNASKLMESNTSDRLSIGVIETFSNLSFASGFILMTYKYHRKSWNLLALFVSMVTLVFAVIQARRGMILMYSGMLAVAFLIYFHFSRIKVYLLYGCVFCALLGAWFLMRGEFEDMGMFRFLSERGIENTRAGVEVDLYKDMTETEWIIGKGINGSYFSPGIEEEQETHYRDLVETGFLQAILKGGIIYLFLILAIAIPAIFKGFFYSNNLLSKASAAWILLAMLDSYPTIIFSFTLNYITVWVAIAICYSSRFRKMHNDDVMNVLHNPQSFEN